MGGPGIFFGGGGTRRGRGEPFPTIAAPGIFFLMRRNDPRRQGRPEETHFPRSLHPVFVFDAAEWAQALGEAPITLYRLSVHIWNAWWPHFAGPPPSPGHKKPGEKNSDPGGSE
jgi:hypothetical protein